MKTTGSITTILQRLSRFVMAALAAVGVVACSSDSPDMPDGNDEGAGAGMLSIGFRVAAPGAKISRAEGTAQGKDFEDGVGLESTIDFQSGNYRVYFFDNNDKYITDWNGPADMHVLAGNDYWLYRFTGAVPEELKAHNQFKVMVLANWPDYPDYHNIDLTDMTISNFVNQDWAKFKAFSSFELSIPERRLIPFYGISDLKEITTYEENKTYDLDDINLLRAVAKVEVIFNGGTNKLTLKDSPFIVGVNPEGFCAPAGEYGTGNKWDTDYISDLHLPFTNNNNHENAIGAGYHMLKVDDTDGANKYIAYLPEYRNVGVGTNYSRIYLNLDLGNDLTREYELNFATYTNGSTTNADGKNGPRFDIRRNDLYRFYVTADIKNIQVEMVPYTGLELDVEFKGDEFPTE